MSKEAPAAGVAIAEIEDVQGRADTRRIPINKVGVKDIFHPVRVKDRSGGEQHTIANFNMYVNLPHDFKGTHMSRFVEILHRHEREISVRSFKEMLAEMTDHLEAQSGHIEMSFPYFVSKKAPISGVESLMDYQASLIGARRDGETTTYIKVVVPVTSLCPCSKKISAVWRAQSAFARHHQGAHYRLRLDRGNYRHRGIGSVVRAVRDTQASRRKIRHRARLR